MIHLRKDTSPGAYARSPRMRRASWTSFGMMVTRLAWMAHKFVSSNKPTKYASDASWSAKTAEDWNRKSVLKSCAISRTRRWNGSLRIKSSVDFWYLRISRSATVPGRYLCGFLTPPVAGADLRAALVASCLRGALPPVDLRAVCFVRAIFTVRFARNCDARRRAKTRLDGENASRRARRARRSRASLESRTVDFLGVARAFAAINAHRLCENDNHTDSSRVITRRCTTRSRFYEIVFC